MADNKIEFYHSKVRIFFAVIILFLFVVMGGFVLYVAYIEADIIFMALGLFIMVLFSFFSVGNLFKLVRDYPYIIITDEYIQLDSFTKSEATIYFTDIETLKVSETSFQGIVEIVLKDEDNYFAQMSVHNKVRLGMNRPMNFALFTISAKVVPKEERGKLLNVLDHVMKRKLNNEPLSIETVLKQEDVGAETDFMKKYDPTPPVDKTIDRAYFLKSYGYGFIFFAISFILFYLMLNQSDGYLVYIIVSFIFYPFAKVLIDWMFGFKLKHSLSKQKGVTYYFEQLIYMFDFGLFHASVFVAPFGLVFLLIRYIMKRMKQ